MTFVKADGGDLCGTDDGKLATARSRTPQLPPRFNEASHAAKTFFFLTASVLKVKKFQSFPGKLVVCPEAGGSDLSKADGGYLATAHSPNSTAGFPERHSFHSALAKFPRQRRRSSSLLCPS